MPGAVADFVAVAGVAVVARRAFKLEFLNAPDGRIAGINSAWIAAIAFDWLAADAAALAIAGIVLGAGIAIVAPCAGFQRNEAASALSADCFAHALVIRDFRADVPAGAAVVDIIHHVDALIPAVRLACGAGATVAQCAVRIRGVAHARTTLIAPRAGIPTAATGDRFSDSSAACQRPTGDEAKH